MWPAAGGFEVADWTRGRNYGYISVSNMRARAFTPDKTYLKQRQTCVSSAFTKKHGCKVVTTNRHGARNKVTSWHPRDCDVARRNSHVIVCSAETMSEKCTSYVHVLQRHAPGVWVTASHTHLREMGFSPRKRFDM